MSFIVSSFYTVNTPYESIIQELIESGKKFGVEIYVNSYPSHKSWELNCWLKPVSILETMNKFPDKNILYLDADSVIMGDLTYFNTFDYDVGCHILNDQWKEKFAGTIFLKNSIKTRSFVATWYSKIITRNNLLGESKSLDQTIQDHLNDQKITFQSIPPEYAKIFDRECHKDVMPMIQHNQASRKNKTIVNVI